MDSLEVKFCIDCKTDLPLEMFYKSVHAKDGKYPYCKPCNKIRSQKLYTDKTKAKKRSNLLKNKYGLMEQDYLELIERQDGVCAICFSEPSQKKSLCVDHDHKCCDGQRSCGECVRGLLCVKCNTLIGLADDNVEVLMRAVRYLLHGISEQLENEKKLEELV